MSKVVESLDTQRKQLLDLLNKRDNLEEMLTNVRESISQLRGSIAALEYVLTLEPKAE